MTHTTGPFVAVIPPSSAYRFRYIEAVCEEGNIRVAEICDLTPEQGETRAALANANLLAAAPDMLAALKELLFNALHGNGLEALYKTQANARAAIAKAEGRA
jgi:hypothetical protein